MPTTIVSRPNLVLFIPDQLRADSVGAFGNPIARTPNIDALAARGTIFGQCFAQHSVCGPSRASIFTGWYPHVNGHRRLSYLLQPWEPNLLKLLRDAGYNVGWAGQRGDTFAPGVTEASTDFAGFIVRPTMLFMPSPYPQGHKFADAFYHGRRNVDGVALDFDEATVRTAEAWLAQRPREPWALLVAMLFPHCPFEVEEPWYSMHDRARMPIPAATPERGPRYADAIRERYGTARLTREDWAEIIATYYGMVSRVDHQLSRVTSSVERAGFAGRTVTAFFADHGEYLGDYGLVEKWPSGLHDCLLRNPLIIAGPGLREGQACDGIVEMIDLLPTVLDLAEVKAKHTHFGRSLMPVLRDGAASHRERAFSEGGFTLDERHLLERAPFPYHNKAALQHEDPTLVGKAVAMRSQRWSYVYRLYESDELYDRESDPHELHNLSGQPEVAGIERELRDATLEWLVATGDVMPWEEDPRNPPLYTKRS